MLSAPRRQGKLRARGRSRSDSATPVARGCTRSDAASRVRCPWPSSVGIAARRLLRLAAEPIDSRRRRTRTIAVALRLSRPAHLPHRGAGGGGRAPPRRMGRAGGEPATRPPRPPADLPAGLFALGVASGDPCPTGVVLWTRLAPAPLDGGGMPAVDVPGALGGGDRRAVPAAWRRGDAVAAPGGALGPRRRRRPRPAAWYYYRFIVGDQVSPVGRTRTAPAAGPRGDGCGSCSPAARTGSRATGRVAHAPAEDLDVVLHLGDYIYEGGTSASAVRRHNSGEIRDPRRLPEPLRALQGRPGAAGRPRRLPVDRHLGRPRGREQLRRPRRRRTRPRCPTSPPGGPPPTRPGGSTSRSGSPPPTGPDLPIYRSLRLGRLARFHVLDTRQYRTDQACGGEHSGPPAPSAPTRPRTLLGAEQEAWLGGSLAASTATWDVLANQIVMTPMPFAGHALQPGPVGRLHRRPQPPARPDRRAGGVANPVVLTGDIHAAGVADLVDEYPTAPRHRPSAPSWWAGRSARRSRADLADIAEQPIRAAPPRALRRHPQAGLHGLRRRPRPSW